MLLPGDLQSEPALREPGMKYMKIAIMWDISKIWALIKPKKYVRTTQ